MKQFKPKTRTSKRTKFGLELESSAREILAHVKGEKIPTSHASDRVT